MTSQESPTPQIAIWYFVGATFVFAAPVIFFPDAGVWLRIATLALGFALIVVGGIQLGREITQRRENKAAAPPPFPPPPVAPPPVAPPAVAPPRDAPPRDGGAS
ncbi:MAG: hypothetical protein ABW024_07450 [Microbacterium sp.]